MIKIEQYNNAYKQQVIDLVLNIQQNEFNIPVTIEDQPDLLDIPAIYGKGNGGFWIAVKNNILLGTIGLLDIGQNKYALRKMFVKKEFRGKEHLIALQLLGEVIQRCKNRKGETIYLGTIGKLKAARKFYEKNGFHKISPGKLPDFFPRVHVDTIFFELNILNAGLAEDLTMTEKLQSQ
ncbi:MAG: GNAT family N-acetyltransferase [Ferruginibacter sp.]